MDLAGHWSQSTAPAAWAWRAPIERDVVIFTDPGAELDRRASEWGHTFRDHSLDELGRFAAGLAAVEARSWADEEPIVATRAYEARRRLLADRIIHWAVPWMDSVGRHCPEHSDAALADQRLLLELGDEMRVAPLLPGREGLRPEGEDSYGPTTVTGDQTWLASLWSGAVALERELGTGSALAATYEVEASRWDSLAAAHVGSAELWSDLADRARATARWLRSL